jgi:Tfp pilus assembly protein PilF
MKYCALMVFALSLLLGACQSNPSQPEKPAPPPTASVARPVASPASKRADGPSPAEAPALAKKAEASLANGIQFYEDGNYKGAQAELQSALDQGLASKLDQARANKYLAFIACTGQKRDVCKTHFLRALALNPKFQLSKAEAGHPLWGPVFQEAKAEAGKKAPAKKK